MKKIRVMILIIVLVAMFFISFNDSVAANDMDSRFEIINVQPGLKIIKDNHTNIMYLLARDGYGGGLTVLLDANGKP